MDVYWVNVGHFTQNSIFYKMYVEYDTVFGLKEVTICIGKTEVDQNIKNDCYNDKITDISFSSSYFLDIPIFFVWLLVPTLYFSALCLALCESCVLHFISLFSELFSCENLIHIFKYQLHAVVSKKSLFLIPNFHELQTLLLWITPSSHPKGILNTIWLSSHSFS